jgi:hypothetical protein
MQHKRDNGYLLLTYANMNMTKLWCKIIPNISVEQTTSTGKFYLYLYPLGT